jgi:hypothetical protein
VKNMPLTMYYKKDTLPKKKPTPTQAEFYMEVIFELI